MRTVFLVVAAALACAGDGAQRAGIPDSAPGAAAVAAADTCGLIRAQAHPDPFQLVREYVELDAQGQFLQPNAWLDTAYHCPPPERVNGPGGFTVIAGFRVRPLSAGPEKARVQVSYERIGWAHPADSTRTLVRGIGVERDTFSLVHTGFGWRVVSPPLVQRVLADRALTLVRFRDSDRSFLQEVLARRRSRR